MGITLSVELVLIVLFVASVLATVHTFGEESGYRRAIEDMGEEPHFGVYR
jgi:hypothetical protein